MDLNDNAELIAERFVSRRSWRTRRQILNAHCDVLKRAGVTVQSGAGWFSLVRYFNAWEAEREGIGVLFVKEEGKEVSILPTLVRREGTQHPVASIEDPGLRECLVAVLKGVPPNRQELKIHLLDGRGGRDSLPFFSYFHFWRIVVS